MNQASTWKRPQLAKRTGAPQPLPAPKVPRNEYYQQEGQGASYHRSSRDGPQVLLKQFINIFHLT